MSDPASKTTARLLLWTWHVFNFGWIFRYENGKFSREPNSHLKALKDQTPVPPNV